MSFDQTCGAQVDLGGDPSAGRIHEALQFPGCADFQPLYYLNGLADAIVHNYDGRIFENSQVMKTEGPKVMRASHACLVSCMYVLQEHSCLPGTGMQTKQRLAARRLDCISFTTSFGRKITLCCMVWDHFGVALFSGDNQGGLCGGGTRCCPGNQLTNPSQPRRPLPPGAVSQLCRGPAHTQSEASWLQSAHLCVGTEATVELPMVPHNHVVFMEPPSLVVGMNLHSLAAQAHNHFGCRHFSCVESWALLMQVTDAAALVSVMRCKVRVGNTLCIGTGWLQGRPVLGHSNAVPLCEDRGASSRRQHTDCGWRGPSSWHEAQGLQGSHLLLFLKL